MAYIASVWRYLLASVGVATISVPLQQRQPRQSNSFNELNMCAFSQPFIDSALAELDRIFKDFVIVKVMDKPDNQAALAKLIANQEVSLNNSFNNSLKSPLRTLKNNNFRQMLPANTISHFLWTTLSTTYKCTVYFLSRSWSYRVCVPVKLLIVDMFGIAFDVQVYY